MNAKATQTRRLVQVSQSHALAAIRALDLSPPDRREALGAVACLDPQNPLNSAARAILRTLADRLIAETR